MAADSFRDIEIQNGMKEMTNICQLKEIAELNRAASEMERNREQLREAEIRNRELIQWDQKRIKPLLENIHQQMKVKKQKIDRLRIKLQTSEEEIIHI
jgi:glyceraldehyde-3-phosphate dehydrogenase/erythrose-4-phosphate dehydrogenase